MVVLSSSRPLFITQLEILANQKLIKVPQICEIPLPHWKIRVLIRICQAPHLGDAIDPSLDGKPLVQCMLGFPIHVVLSERARPFDLWWLYLFELRIAIGPKPSVKLSATSFQEWVLADGASKHRVAIDTLIQLRVFTETVDRLGAIGKEAVATFEGIAILTPRLVMPLDLAVIGNQFHSNLGTP
ncbi:hypothetical protein L2E82_39131 [Cichorium intybus]|uniref:Uncharacterized protein n=1 Tax=Cichorium intybus TaxID=13427 RepID=A0ACB9AHC6_CICIN|nr:hypothetical protein L2E82_39131 [Cichorium intybus]